MGFEFSLPFPVERGYPLQQRCERWRSLQADDHRDDLADRLRRARDKPYRPSSRHW
jgi:hypothetical protein